MKTSAEYRASAREALTGHWLAAAAAGVIAVFFGAETFEYLPEREELERLYRGESPAIQALLLLLALSGGCFLDAYMHTAEAAFVRDLPGGVYA